MDNSNGYRGAQDPNSATSDFNERDFHIRQVLSQAEHMTLVRIVSVTNNGGLSAVGFVDVTPLVLQVDGNGNPVDHNTIHGLPYFRLQGGTRAVIIDPEVGDIGYAVFADRDISTVKATKDAALPGSRRRNDMADGVYVGGVLNGVPTSVIRMQGDDIHAECPGKFIVTAAGGTEIHSPTIALDGAITQGGGGTYPATFTSSTFTHNGKNIGATHVHSGVQPGAGNSGQPV